MALKSIHKRLMTQRINAEINNISNIEFVVADAAIATKMLVENNVKMDVIVVDPPRKRVGSRYD